MKQRTYLAVDLMSESDLWTRALGELYELDPDGLQGSSHADSLYAYNTLHACLRELRDRAAQGRLNI
jgi:hypothetical protein